MSIVKNQYGGIDLPATVVALEARIAKLEGGAENTAEPDVEQPAPAKGKKK